MSWASLSWTKRLRRRLSAPASITVVALTIIPTVMLLATLAYPVGGGGVREFTSSDQTRLGGSSGASGIRPLRASFVRDQLPGLSTGFEADSALTGTRSLFAPARRSGSLALSGPLALVEATAIKPLLNDHFASAYPIGVVPFNAHSRTTGATSDPGEPSGCSNGAGTVWFTFTPAKAQTLVFSTFGSDFPGSIAVYTGVDVHSLQQRSCGSRFMTFGVKQATTYFVQIGGAGDLVFHLGIDPGRGVNEITSRSTGGRQSQFASDTGSVSADGRYVTFDSADTALADDDPTRNYQTLAQCPSIPIPTANLSEDQRGSVRPCYISMYQRDMLTGKTYGLSGGFNQHSNDDGSIVSFMAIENNTGQIYVWNRATAHADRADLKPDRTPSNQGSADPVVSGNGRYVAFYSNAQDIAAHNTQHVVTFVFDRVTQTTRMVRTPSGGELNDWSAPTCMNEDGRYLVISTAASNLAPGDTNNAEDYYRIDLVTGDAVRVSVSSTGAQGNKASQRVQFISGHCLSADGRYVMFNSSATNLVPDDTNGSQDLFVHDIVTGTTERVDVSSTGDQANENLALQSARTETPVGNTCTSAAVKQFTLDEILAAHSLNLGLPVKGLPVLLPAGYCGGTDDLRYGYGISSNGRYVVFGSNATNLTPDGDTNNASDIFRHDRLTGQTIRISNAPDGTQGERDSWGHLVMTADGRGVVYQSRASNLVARDLNNDVDVFYWHETSS
jgi:hypothetical protein